MKTAFWVALVAMILDAPTLVQADRLVNTDTTQNGGTFVVNPAGGLFVSDVLNNPSLTLTNGATTSGVKTVFVGGSNGGIYGGQIGPRGKLVIENGSTLNNLGTGQIAAGIESTGSAIVSGKDSQWLNSQWISVGTNGNGELIVEKGGYLTSAGGSNIGDDLGHNTSHGSVTVTGVDSKWQNDGLLTVGYEGTGTLTVSDGGTIITGSLIASLKDLSGNGNIFTKGVIVDADLELNSGSQKQQQLSFGSGGKLNIDLGNGAEILGAGYEGIGTLAVTDGVQVKSTEGYLGYRTGSDGTATISGLGSQWQIASTIYVGYSGGTGTLRIENGGVVISNDTRVSYGSTMGTVIVSGIGSESRSNGYMYIFDGGSLRVENGGFVISSDGYVASNGTPSETTITGSGSRWQNSNSMSIGGSGSLHINDGGIVTSKSAFIGDSFYLGTSNVTVSGVGSLWQNSDQMRVGEYGAGTLTVQYGGIVEVDGNLTVGAHGTISGNGGSIIGDVVNEGTISPGNSPGILTIDGDLNSTGLIDFQLAGTTSGLFDQLIVTGDLTLGGVIEFDLINGYIPTAHSSFNVLDFGSFIDAGYKFDFTHAALGAGLSWDTSTFAIDGTVRVVPEAGSLIFTGIGMVAGLVCWRMKSR